MIDDEQRKLHARRSLRLAAVALGAFFLLVFVLPVLAPVLNTSTFLRYPVGLLLLLHGTVIGIIVLIFLASARQDTLDRRHGMTSEF